ncbi:LptF/LptG family permease [Agriterribacter sp.]|uniref:LptF/LptG family permease n=1 Tax=Agriterribacter sp. TaxID=2821509 RepID=UPI002B88C2FC|nr:LptF/LptG family permease [Agriterribacter sp.]HTN05817.1 LptF/LptG family permease [Agriterribacter sp.]
MIKKLDKLVIKSFIGPFIVTFFITLFVLVLQFFWKYIDDLVGKGLDFFTILRLTSYVTATAVPLALPLAILISSIMTFGKLGESFETVAIKSAGIPLLRFMRPLFIISILISGVAFSFSNYIIPVAQLKFQTLLYDITVAKPAFNLKEGVFFREFEGYTIKIGKKDKDNTTIHNVIIFERNYSLQDNIITSEQGKMNISADKKFLEFYLENGWRYEERGPSYTVNTDYIRLGFKHYKKVFDLSSFKMMQTPDSLFKDNFRMLNIRQLNKTIDSLKKTAGSDIEKKTDREVGINYTFVKREILPREKEYPVTEKVSASAIHIRQSNKPLAPKKPQYNPQKSSVVLALQPPEGIGYALLLPDSARRSVITRAIDRISSQKNSLDIIAEEARMKQKDLRFHLIEWHRKFSLSFACVVLFLIGAPLGSIIRKGGMGMPLVIAVIFFLIFHLLNMFGEKFVREDITSAFSGMWLSTMVLLPVGIFFTYKAMHDSQLFNKEFYYRFFKTLGLLLKKMKSAKAGN